MNREKPIRKPHRRHPSWTQLFPLFPVMGVLLTLSCSTTGSKPEPGSKADPPFPQEEQVVPFAYVNGTVRFVNPALKFLVFDFALDQFPEPGQFLSVYRRESWIGEIQVTGPTQKTYTAANILSGDIQVGDTVQSD